MSLIETLGNELLSLQTFNDSLAVIEEDQADKKASLILREKKVVVRETSVLDETNALATKERTLNTLSVSLLAKRTKLDDEWKRMLVEREKIEKMSEDVAKDALKVANERKILAEDQKKAKVTASILERRQIALTDLNRKIEIKKAKAKAAGKRVDEDSAIE